MKDIHVQVLLPFLLSELHANTVEKLIKHEPYIFEDYLQEDIPRIDTGDGGFIIFNNPLCGLLYTIYFQFNLDLFNTYHVTPEFRDLIGSIEVRYSMAYDKLFKSENNFYGPSIINSARINSKDKLCRFLIDQNSKDWFTEYFNGIENICQLNDVEVKNILFKAFNLSKGELIYKVSSIFTKHKDKHWGIKNINLIDIGKIQSKDQIIYIYSLHLQILFAMLHPNSNGNEIDKDVKITSTLGNLSTVGLGE
jgi:hypothetical protein